MGQKTRNIPPRKNPYNLKVGDKVKTKFLSEEKDIVRTLVKISESEALKDRTTGYETESGYYAEADEGEVCPHCGRKGHPIGKAPSMLDLLWFRPADQPYPDGMIY